MRTLPIRIAMILLLTSCAASAQSPSLIGLPQANDVTCNAGEYYLYPNSGTATWRKCEDGIVSNLDTGGAAGTATELDQTGTGADLRFDSSANCYYIDVNHNSSMDMAPTTGEREGCVGLGDDIWPEEFASGSTTLGIQEAMAVICTNGKPERGAILRLRGGVYDLGMASLTIPANCNGFTMSGVSGDTYNGVVGAGTEIKTSINGDFLTIPAAMKNVHLSDFQITASPGASTRLIVGGSLVSRLHIENIRCSKTGAASANGTCIHLTDPVKSLIENNESELLGAGFVHTGTLGAGGTSYVNNRVETQGNATGVGILIGEANYACTNVLLEGNILEGNNIGLKIDTTASGAKSCAVTLITPHHENSVGSNYEDVRATGANSVLLIGGYAAGAGSGAERVFHRTSQTDTAVVDMFIGGGLYGTIQMDAGACMIYGPSDWYSGGDISPCARLSVDASGGLSSFYIDVNSDGDFDAGTDARLADADLIDLQDGTLTYSKVGGATASKCARFDASGNLIAASGDCAAGDTGGGGGAVGSDPIWDAAGDLAIGTGADTAAKLTIGSTGQVLRVSGGAVGWGDFVIDFASGDTSTDGFLDVPVGGLGVGTLTSHGVLLGAGTGDVVVTAAPTNGQILVGVTGADPAPQTVSGDGTLTSGGVLEVTQADALETNGTNCAAGSYARGVDTAINAENCTVDDDVPDAGDFGAATDIDSNGAIKANAVALGTDTFNNYVASVADSGAAEIMVAGSGSENAAVTLALVPGITRDSELQTHTNSTSAPVNGTNGCAIGDSWLNYSSHKAYWCQTAGTPSGSVWYGIALVASP